jgi:hypothetical protein
MGVEVLQVWFCIEEILKSSNLYSTINKIGMPKFYDLKENEINGYYLNLQNLIILSKDTQNIIE